jgi:hypothetical protein
MRSTPGKSAEGSRVRIVPARNSFSRVKLGDAGIDGKLSSRAQGLAAQVHSFVTMIGIW